jgi:hypothetical protein
VTLTTWEGQTLPQPQPGTAVVRLPPLDELAERWLVVGPLLARATVRTGCYEPIDLLHLAMTGRVGIWVCEVDGGIEAAVATEVKQYPRRRVLEIMFTGGHNMAAWIKPLVEAIDRHAREAGCSHVATCGRPGWIRAWGGEPTGDIAIVRGV